MFTNNNTSDVSNSSRLVTEMAGLSIIKIVSESRYRQS